MSTRRIENPRVTDGSRWLGKRNSEWFVFKQVGTYWESRENPTAAYNMLCEETGTVTKVDAQTLYDSIKKKQLVEIGQWRKEDILKNQ